MAHSNSIDSSVNDDKFDSALMACGRGLIVEETTLYFYNTSFMYSKCPL